MSRQVPLLFQFHKGTIKTTFTDSELTEIRDFNSIKVRLKPELERIDTGLFTFQFHKGTIKTHRL